MDKLAKLFFVSALAAVAFFFLAQTSSLKKSRKAGKRINTVVEEKPFVIVIPSYNNEKFCKRNLDSALEQNYHNFRIIYIDDCSTDETYQKAQDVIKASQQGRRVTFIRNEKNRGALFNLYQVIHHCNDEEIIVALDGDDFLAHQEVLSTLNHIYHDPGIWMTYGSFLDYPSYSHEIVACREIPQRVIRKNRFRKEEWVSSHLRTFYASLFKKIKLQNLLFKGDFFPMAWDLAFMLPMLEMAGGHSRFIPDILYLYNRGNPLSDHKINFSLQTACGMEVRKQKPYPRLELLEEQKERIKKSDLVIFSYDRPLQLYALLESIERYVKNVAQINVIYRTSNQAYSNAYEEVQRIFPQASFLKQSDEFLKDFKPLLMQAVFEKESPYVLFAVDDMLLKDFVDLSFCIELMEKTHAYGFYLTLGTHVDFCYMLNKIQGIPPYIDMTEQDHDENVHAWQFKEGFCDWKYPNSLDLVLYRKKDIIKDFTTLSFQTPNELESKWALRAKTRRVGLFYTHSKALNLPLNIVSPSFFNRSSRLCSPEELLEKFNEGLKIDLTPLFQLKNTSRHVDYKPSFIKREAYQK